MARRAPIIVATLVCLAVGWACFGDAIRGRQFAYRDAAHYYYPLYQKVQTEWESGRVPLWETEENAGMPLLGNPTAAVLYPGKLIYTLLPYPLAARVYVMVHTVLCFVGMFLLARSLAISPTGAVISALSYAFGAPVLFQYCNIIYLVGAAWAPWAFRAIDGWLRLGRRFALVELALVLAMQVLGGEPQSAYLEGLCAGGYALMLSRSQLAGGFQVKLKHILLLLLGLVVWSVATIVWAHYLGEIRPKKSPVPTFGWTPFVPVGVALIWACIVAVFLVKWRKKQPVAMVLGRQFTGLMVAAILAGAVASAQLLPVLEFARLTGRNSDESSHDVYPFSLEPYRVVELIWPNVFGTINHGNHLWLSLIPPATSHRIWVPSLYIGGATLLLALAGMGIRQGPRWRGWLTIIACLTLLASFGEFLSPLWIGRFFEPIVQFVGPHDPPETNTIRLDGCLRDGDGSFYWFISTFIPGLQQFRYPSKLLTFTILALTLLAGHGWDRLAVGERPKLRGGLIVLLAISTTLLLIALAIAKRLEAFFEYTKLSSTFGPLEPSGAAHDIIRAFAHASILFGLLAIVLRGLARRPRLASCAIVVLVGADLAWANSHLIMTAKQAEFEGKPKVLEIIEAAEKSNPAPGPYRIHRMPIWAPEVWRSTASPDRVVDFLRWERETIQPKYGLPYGISYTHTQGVAELYDYDWFFGPFTRKLDPSLARQMRLNDPSEPIVYYPRRGFDMWNTRYFILPAYTPWTSPERGVASLLHETEVIYPKKDQFSGPEGPKRQEDFLRNFDYQVVRNPAAFPRAWVVHDVRFLNPMEGLVRKDRQEPVQEMLYAGDPFWQDDTKHIYDLKSLAYVETTESVGLSRYRTRGATGVDEAVTVKIPDPQRVELETNLNRPGFVILCDVFYPGWTLKIDGQPAEILRANRMMRGAAVDAGKHTLVYEYRPRSFMVGKVLSGIGLLGVGLVAGWSLRKRKI